MNSHSHVRADGRSALARIVGFLTALVLALILLAR